MDFRPVYDGYFADPFVWKAGNRYFAVGTGPAAPMDSSENLTSRKIDGDERAFPLITSLDLKTWTWVGGALRVPEPLAGGDFWAPEVACSDGVYYLYYSVSTEGLRHKLRVAKSAVPEGPYEDVGLLMANADECPFAIDPHAFRDDDGEWYLFYARDFLDCDNGFRAGTGLVMDRLDNMTRLSGHQQTVLRARSDWQLFRARRVMYGRVFDWHTLEGPCVRKREGRYYCFYSGGCYENDSYGVDYGVAERVSGPYRDTGNERGPRVMKTTRGHVIGPGHNSIVTGPDQSDYVAYHAWDSDMYARRFCISRLLWKPTGPVVEGFERF